MQHEALDRFGSLQSVTRLEEGWIPLKYDLLEMFESSLRVARCFKSRQFCGIDSLEKTRGDSGGSSDGEDSRQLGQPEQIIEPAQSGKPAHAKENHVLRRQLPGLLDLSEKLF